MYTGYITDTDRGGGIPWGSSANSTSSNWQGRSREREEWLGSDERKLHHSMYPASAELVVCMATMHASAVIHSVNNES